MPEQRAVCGTVPSACGPEATPGRWCQQCLELRWSLGGTALGRVFEDGSEVGDSTLGATGPGADDPGLQVLTLRTRLHSRLPPPLLPFVKQCLWERSSGYNHVSSLRIRALSQAFSSAPWAGVTLIHTSPQLPPSLSSSRTCQPQARWTSSLPSILHFPAR